MTEITLYQFENCPFCAKVRVKLDQMDLKCEKINVSRDRNNPVRKELFEKSNVLTVPVIKIDGKYLGDSEVIISYLDSL